MMMYFMPFMFIFSGLFFQMGVVIYTTTAGIWAYLQMLWVIRNMPNPNSAAYNELLAKRQDAYQSWARPFFADYDEKRRDLADGSDELKALNETTLTEVRSRAKRQKIASDFPQAMSAGEIVSVYRNLSMQEWTTLPDEVWMKGVKVATERAAERREAAAKREGADVLGVVAIFTYQLEKADKKFAEAGVQLETLSNYTELIHLAEEQGYITSEGLELLHRFKENQETWQNK